MNEWMDGCSLGYGKECFVFTTSSSIFFTLFSLVVACLIAYLYGCLLLFCSFMVLFPSMLLLLFCAGLVIISRGVVDLLVGSLVCRQLQSGMKQEKEKDAERNVEEVEMIAMKGK